MSIKYTNQELDELYESSKLDNTIFVGSQIRQLVGMIRDLQKPALTVREAFTKAFGEVPDGTTCHIGYPWHESVSLIQYQSENYPLGLRAMIKDKQGVDIMWECRGNWHAFVSWGIRCVTPDISNDPAESFRGFFGAAYDAVLTDLGDGVHE